MMMRRFIVVSLAVCALARGASALEAKYGAKFGWNLAGVKGDIEDNGYADRKSGSTIGASVELGFTEAFALETGLLYETKGAEGVHFADGVAVDLDIAYLVIPALARFDLPGGSACASVGLTFGFPVKGERTEGGFTTDVKDEAGTEVSIVVGLGGDVCSLGDGALSLGVEYSYGLNDLADDTESRSSVISVVMGLRF
jgi:hypothetical protein